jgi:hypothetical protein
MWYASIAVDVSIDVRATIRRSCFLANSSLTRTCPICLQYRHHLNVYPQVFTWLNCKVESAKSYTLLHREAQQVVQIQLVYTEHALNDNNYDCWQSD